MCFWANLQGKCPRSWLNAVLQQTTPLVVNATTSDFASYFPASQELDGLGLSWYFPFPCAFNASCSFCHSTALALRCSGGGQSAGSVRHLRSAVYKYPCPPLPCPHSIDNIIQATAIESSWLNAAKQREKPRNGERWATPAQARRTFSFLHFLESEERLHRSIRRHADVALIYVYIYIDTYIYIHTYMHLYEYSG